MPFPVVETVRFAATAATSLGVGKVVSEVIKHNVTPVTRMDRTLVQVGGAALSLVVAGAATARVEEMVRGVAERVTPKKEIDTTS